MQAMQPGNAPSSAIQPGVIGGGALPSVASPTLAASLALLPLGLAAVAVFPPFATPRTFPATAVIFSKMVLQTEGLKDTFLNCIKLEMGTTHNLVNQCSSVSLEK